MKDVSAVHSQAAYHRNSQTLSKPASDAEGYKGELNPAHAARAALSERPDLASRPFGSLVSLLARGMPLPPVENDTVEASQNTDSTEILSDTTAPTI